MLEAPPFANRRTEIAGISVAELAEKFGTPTFVYDAAQIARRLEDLKAFDHVRYAEKACSNLVVLDLLRRQGALVDTVSANIDLTDFDGVAKHSIDVCVPAGEAAEQMAHDCASHMVHGPSEPCTCGVPGRPCDGQDPCKSNEYR